jgi:isoleucyl-tRNA synthetase
MSKSLGNTIDPNKVCNSLGADILRLWVSSVDYQSDVRISDNILSQITEVYRKIRNTLRFLLSNLAGFDPMVDRVSVDQLDELDRFTLGQLDQMSERVLAAYESYEFNVVYQSVHHFCAVDLSALYLDIVKDRLYASSPDAVGRRATQTVLYEALTVITRLVAPVLPHTADEIWKFTPGVQHISVQLSQMPDVKQNRYDAELEQKWLKFIEIRDDVLKALEDARAKKLIGNALGAAIDLYVDEETAGLLSQFEQLEQLFIVSKAAVHTAESIPAGSIQFKKLAILVSAAEGEKCERCWNVTPEVGMSKAHSTLCRRCAEVVTSHYKE